MICHITLDMMLMPPLLIFAFHVASGHHQRHTQQRVSSFRLLRFFISFTPFITPLRLSCFASYSGACRLMSATPLRCRTAAADDTLLLPDDAMLYALSLVAAQLFSIFRATCRRLMPPRRLMLLLMLPRCHCSYCLLTLFAILRIAASLMLSLMTLPLAGDVACIADFRYAHAMIDISLLSILIATP